MDVTLAMRVYVWGYHYGTCSNAFLKVSNCMCWTHVHVDESCCSVGHRACCFCYNICVYQWLALPSTWDFSLPGSMLYCSLIFQMVQYHSRLFQKSIPIYLRSFMIILVLFVISSAAATHTTICVGQS